jgi:hypothetical protein
MENCSTSSFAQLYFDYVGLDVTTTQWKNYCLCISNSLWYLFVDLGRDQCRELLAIFAAVECNTMIMEISSGEEVYPIIIL